MVLRKLKGYTLIELIVVIAIIGVMTVFAIPAFARYGKNSDFNQKVDEIKILFDQGYLLSKNPENSQIVQYEIGFNTDYVYLQSCNLADIDPITQLCNSGGGTQFVRQVSISSASALQSFSCDGVATSCSARIIFSTDRAKSILLNPDTITDIYFSDYNPSVRKKVDFTFDGLAGQGKPFKTNSLIDTLD